MAAVQQAFNGPLTADTGQVHSGTIWLEWLLYPICLYCLLTRSAGLQQRYKLRTVHIHGVQISKR